MFDIFFFFTYLSFSCAFFKSYFLFEEKNRNGKKYKEILVLPYHPFLRLPLLIFQSGLSLVCCWCLLYTFICLCTHYIHTYIHKFYFLRPRAFYFVYIFFVICFFRCYVSLSIKLFWYGKRVFR